MTGVCIKRGNLDTDTPTRRSSRGDESRGQGHASPRQGVPKIASTSPGTRKEAWTDFPHGPQKYQCRPQPGLGPLAFRTVRQHISVFQSPVSCTFVLQQSEYAESHQPRFRGPQSHVWRVATALHGEDPGHGCHCRKFHWTVLWRDSRLLIASTA